MTAQYQYEDGPGRLQRPPRAGHHQRTRFIRTPAYIDAERLVYAPENAALTLATTHLLNRAAENSLPQEAALQRIQALVREHARTIRHTRRGTQQ
ncbi:MAG TPA: hypothetical protein VLA19_00495 [Herpetosiphonaceae bacterium]|nr:hypothetical protein [Herpetosiphonaceae bacterium]